MPAIGELVLSRSRHAPAKTNEERGLCLARHSATRPNPRGPWAHTSSQFDCRRPGTTFGSCIFDLLWNLDGRLAALHRAHRTQPALGHRDRREWITPSPPPKAIQELVPTSQGKLSAGRLGKKLQTLRERVVGGRVLVNVGEKGGSKLWAVKVVDETAKPMPSPSLAKPERSEGSGNV